MEASRNLDTLDRDSEALLLAIYFTSIATMTPEEYSLHLGEDRDAAIARYRFAVEQALARANFLNCQSVMLLQAAVLFLSCVRPEDDTKYAWSMIALVVRLAQGLGLHRDGTNFGLKPFETEIRRRLWWHICLLDVRLGEQYGTDVMIHERMSDTRLPLNINDDDISPEMREPPEERVGWTDMTFTLARCEVVLCLRRVSYGCRWLVFGRGGSSIKESEKWIQTIYQRIHERYVKYCNPSIPVHWLCATAMRSIMAKLWLVVHHPMTRKDSEASLSTVSRHSLLLTSVEVIEVAMLCARHPKVVKWNWLCRLNMQWPVVVFVLSELCVRPICPLTERAWAAVNAAYEECERTLKVSKGTMWRPIERLMKRAAAFRAKQQDEKRAKLGNPHAPQQQQSLCVSLLQMGNGLESMPLELLPTIYVPILDHRPASTEPEETVQTRQQDSGLDFDFNRNPYGVFNDVFADGTLAASPSDPFPPSAFQQPYVDMDEPGPVSVFEHTATTMDCQQDSSADLDLDWREWDQVMRDFLTDVEKEQGSRTIGSISDWLP